MKRLVDVAAGREVRSVSVPRLGPDTDPGGIDSDDTLLQPQPKVS